MKKIYNYLTFIALAALCFGCAKEIEAPEADFVEEKLAENVPGEELTFIFSVPDSEDTKTALGTKDGSSYPVKWSNGDQNRVSLNGLAPSSSNKDSDTQITASFFAGKGNSIASPYNFLYRGDAGHDNQVSIPAAQSYYANDFDDAAMPMYAASASSSNTVTFNALCSLLKFSITGEKKIDSVTLTAADGTKSLSGTFTIGKTNGLLNGTLTPASGGGTINYNFNGHKQLSDTPFIFYVAVPAGTYEGGITLNIVDNDAGHMTATVMTTNATKTIAAGKVREFENIVYVPDKEQNLKQIYNVATFQEFVSAVAGGKTTLNARLTNNSATLDLSSIASSFESIEGYKGTFDGNGKTISFGTSTATQPLFNELRGVVKNLTVTAKIAETSTSNYEVGIIARSIRPSNEIDDIAGLQNCTANGSVTYTPSDAVSGNACIGGLVGNNRGGTITGCTNNATVTFANNGSNTVHAMQPSIGGVVGRTQKGGDLNTQGDISNNTNAGTVVCGAKFSQGIYLGGVLGYQVEKAESISGCTNSGLVKATASCSTTGPLQIGGVIGMGKGSIESCSNLAAGVVTTEACSVGTYLCQGGVVGRLNREKDSYSGLSNAGTVNVAATGASSGRLIGGVVGRCNEGTTITEFTNSGNINYTAEDANAVYIGGVVASNTVSGIVLDNCHSTGGTITYTGATYNGNQYIGGVVGFSQKEISNCTNAATLNIGGSFARTAGNYNGIGGIVGSMSADAPITNCLNTGNVNYSQQTTDFGYTFVGGVAGRTAGSITNSSNGGTVTITGKNSANNPFYGGVVGSTDSTNEHSITGKYSSASATNYGAVVINTSVQSNKYIYVGGVAGRLHTNGSMTATNAGPITITNLTCTTSLIGGLAGRTNGPVNSGSANLAGGIITITSHTANGSENYFASGKNQAAMIGGVVGEARGAVDATNAGNIVVNGLSASMRSSIGGVVGTNYGVEVSGTNSGSITVSSGSSFTDTFFLGGVVGFGQGDISSCTNNGSVSNAGSVTGDGKYIQVGGIVGYNNDSSVLSNCTNNGDVTNSGSSAGYVYVGGITSETDANITSCINNGSVSNSGEATTQKTSTKIYHVEVGGISGHNASVTLTSCSNSGSVSNTGDSGAGIFIGGISGHSKAATFVTCSNSGAVSNSGYPYDSNFIFDVCIAGLVGYLDGNVTLTGTSSQYNSNSGSITESSTSGYVAIGGIAGANSGSSTDLAYAKNLDGGDIYYIGRMCWSSHRITFSAWNSR